MRYFFLFNDMLVYTTALSEAGAPVQQYSFHRKFDLEKCAVQPVANTEGASRAASDSLPLLLQ
jgi:hypothetical protein